MRANTGGFIAPCDVLGRELLIATIYRALEKQSVVLTAARRMGKTSIIKKMEAESPVGMKAIMHDLEGLRSPLEFVEVVYNDVERLLSTKSKTAKRVRDVVAQLSGTEIKGFKLPNVLVSHWKLLLTKTIEDLAEHQDVTVVMYWDEMPMMLENIRQDHGERTAMEILDILRSLRQMYPKVRMVYTGSIGLHHVITSLHRVGYTNDPTNDMKIIDVPPLSKDDAITLAKQLLDGERIEPSDPAIASYIAESADNIPFYIHHIVDSLVSHEGIIDKFAIQIILDNALTASQDPWSLDHYRNRITTYYPEKSREFAFPLLDVFALADGPLSLGEATSRLETFASAKNNDEIREAMRLLMQDHYLTRDSSGAFSFTQPLIRKWWCLTRGLL